LEERSDVVIAISVVVVVVVVVVVIIIIAHCDFFSDIDDVGSDILHLDIW
jgi:hypothetical protein